MKDISRNFLTRLLETIGPSGYEEGPAAVWRNEAECFATSVRGDVHGSSHAVINPGGRPRVMLAGHIDEIGFVITHIDDDGFLSFAPVGGWDSQVAVGQRVTIKTRSGPIAGVMGKKPIHVIDPDDRKKVTKLEDLWIDIGATSAKDATAAVEIGDPVVLRWGCEELRNGRIVSRAIDDRSGAFVVLEAARLLATELSPSAEVHAVATSQEEIGLRGAQTSAFGIDPQVGIAVDVTVATDHPKMCQEQRTGGKIQIGKGPVLYRGPNANPRLFDLLVRTAQDEKIPYQVAASGRATGTDANTIQTSRSGVATALISIPNRYMHSPCEMVSLEDLEGCYTLLAKAVAAITEKTNLVF